MINKFKFYTQQFTVFKLRSKTRNGGLFICKKQRIAQCCFAFHYRQIFYYPIIKLHVDCAAIHD